MDEGVGVFVWTTYCRMLVSRYRGYSKLRTHTALRSYGRAIPRSIGLP
jgi:hypothetical protein